MQHTGQRGFLPGWLACLPPQGQTQEGALPATFRSRPSLIAARARAFPCAGRLTVARDHGRLTGRSSHCQQRSLAIPGLGGLGIRRGNHESIISEAGGRLTIERRRREDGRTARRIVIVRRWHRGCRTGRDRSRRYRRGIPWRELSQQPPMRSSLCLGEVVGGEVSIRRFGDTGSRQQRCNILGKRHVVFLRRFLFLYCLADVPRLFVALCNDSNAYQPIQRHKKNDFVIPISGTRRAMPAATPRPTPGSRHFSKAEIHAARTHIKNFSNGPKANLGGADNRGNGHGAVAAGSGITCHRAADQAQIALSSEKGIMKCQ